MVGFHTVGYWRIGYNIINSQLPGHQSSCGKPGEKFENGIAVGAGLAPALPGCENVGADLRVLPELK